MTVRLNDRLERVVVQPSADVDDQIAAFCTVFTDLRKAFDSKIGLSTALVFYRATFAIDATSTYLSYQYSLRNWNPKSKLIIASQSEGKLQGIGLIHHDVIH